VASSNRTPRRLQEWLAFALLLLGACLSAAQDLEVVPRKLLVLLDSRETDTFEDNDFQHYLAFPAYHLGLRPVFWDLAEGVPPGPHDMERFRGVVAFTHQLDCNQDLRDWLTAQHQAGRKLLMLSYITSGDEPEEESTCEEGDEVVNKFYEPLGIYYSSLLTAEGAEDSVRVRRARPGWFDFEIRLEDIKRLPYVFQRSTGEENQVHLSAWIEDVEDSATDLVMTGPWGGWAATEYLWGPRGDGRDYEAYLADPFRFLEAAFGWQQMPRVEANVLNGKRVFFSHVDGDGFNSFAYDRPANICGEIVYEDILKDPRYAQLPHTISVISAEVDPATTHPVEASIPTARRIFDLDHVESASHAFSHPMDWRKDELAFEDIVLDGVKYTYDRHKETVGSLETIAALCPKDRAPEVMLWSGSCNPDEGTLRVTREGGYYNMNGGDPRLDEQYDSLTQVAAPVWQVGQELRFSSGAANDFLMTNEWTPPFTGFRGITETFRRTEDPRPLTPVDVYYHFYIAERAESFRTLKSVFNWCLAQDFAHLFTSEYLRSMVDLVEADVLAGPDGWYGARTAGALPTLRFDGEVRHVDMATADGVLGYAHRWDALYVFLDHGQDHRFQLVGEDRGGLRLTDATRPLRLLEPEGDVGLAFEASGPGKSTFRFQGFEPATYVAVTREGGPATLHPTQVLQVGDDGVLELVVELGLGATVRIRGSTASAYQEYAYRLWFGREGRFLLLAAVVTVLGWLLCRFHIPQLPPAEATVPTMDAVPAAAGFEVEATSGEPASTETALPAGGVGPWAAPAVPGAEAEDLDGDETGEHPRGGDPA
jgi:hypothetical protein